jgi:hypothetical protein
MAKAASQFPTLLEVLKTVHPGGMGGDRKVHVSVVDGMNSAAVTRREGVHILAPEQLLAIRIPIQRVQGDIVGYQRHLRAEKVRDFGRWIAEHRDNYLNLVPVIEVSWTGDHLFYTDGQHRAGGAVIARVPMRVLVTKRTEDEARHLFALQAKATRVSKNVLILNSNGNIEEYIQDAVTSTDHPWSNLIASGQSGNSKTRMSASTAFNILRVYAAKSKHMSATALDTERAKFNKKDADELAVLISALGSKVNNPDAFAPSNLRAVAIVARAVFLEREPHRNDRDRWIRKIGRFPFAQYGYVRNYYEMSQKLVAYWNRNLPPERRVVLG